MPSPVESGVAIRTYAFSFICQAGPLEAKACLLAASLHHFVECPHELIACIPGPAQTWGTPAPATLQLLQSLGVRIVSTGNSVDPAYPIANKIDCLRVATSAQKLIFLDSDMLLMRPWQDQQRFGIDFNARPASCATFSVKDDDWIRVHEACGAPLPKSRIRTTHSNEFTWPYFNAAFIAAPGQSGFGDTWLQCCRTIDALADVPNKRPYLDQIALGVAAAKLGMQLDALDERYNHPINFKPLNEDDLPWFCHYHQVQTLLTEPKALECLQLLCATYPLLKSVLQNDPAWAAALAPRRSNRRILSTPELLITGIPRSGTSYLSSLLHQYDNCVVLNEPAEAPAALMESGLPWGVARLFRQIRADVNNGIPVANKLVAGQVSQDTALSNTVERYCPEVAGDDFVLGIKTTVAFLSRLRPLKTAMPRARMVACVRNPLDAIASWKSTFAHLRDADVNSLNVGSPRDPWLSGSDRLQLQRVAAIPETASRRAAWWDFLARLILEARDLLIIVRYDQLVRQPAKVVEQICAGCPIGEPRRPILPSTARTRRDCLDADDIQAIRLLCSASAEALGVPIDSADQP